MTTPTCCAPAGRLAPSAAWSRRHPPSDDLSAQLPVGPCPPAGSGEPQSYWPGPGGWSRTRRRAPDHRPGLHHLRYGLVKEGARHHSYTGQGLSPAAGRPAGTGDVLMARHARGPGQLGAPPTSCARRWDGCATAGPTVRAPTPLSLPLPSPSASTKACTIEYPKVKPTSALVRMRAVELVGEQIMVGVAVGHG